MITLSSDLGYNNAEVALYRAIAQHNIKNQPVVDLYHLDDSYDIESLGYSLFYALKTFPKNAVHIAVCKYTKGIEKILMVQLLDQYVICSDNGLISLMHSLDYNAQVFSSEYVYDNFLLKDYIETIVQVATNVTHKKIDQLKPYPMFSQMKPFNTDLSILENVILCRVIYINELGNVVINLDRNVFEKTVENKQFEINIVNTKIGRISTSYSDTEPNTRLGAIFNPTGFLEIFLTGGNLAQLYGINKYSNNRIEVNIEDEKSGQINF